MNREIIERLLNDWHINFVESGNTGFKQVCESEYPELEIIVCTKTPGAKRSEIKLLKINE